MLVAGRRLYVGRSTRSSHTAIEQLATVVRPFDYEVVAVDFSGCLHLKSCVTQVGESLLLLNPAWVDPSVFAGCGTVAVDPAEPYAGNALALGGAVIHSQHFPRTRARLEAAGLRVRPIALTELAKAEAGVTCCSLLVRGT